LQVLPSLSPIKHNLTSEFRMNQLNKQDIVDLKTILNVIRQLQQDGVFKDDKDLYKLLKSALEKAK
jgi:hypothetical protein